MARPLIGLIGRKQTGKDTTATILGETYGYTPFAFADPLRDLVAAIDPIVHAALMGEPGYEPHVKITRVSDALRSHGYERAKAEFPEYRRLLQVTGTEGIRETLGVKHKLREALGNDVWPYIAEERIVDAISYYEFDYGLNKRVPIWGESLVLTDTRFPNEAELVKKHGGIIVRVARPDLPFDDDAHPSETALDDYPEDFTLVNDGDLLDLRVAVDTLIAKLG